MFFVGSEGKPSFMDAVPVVSHVKTSFLYIIGKEDQALQTLANFKNLTHLWESIKHIDNSIPIYGHVKAFIVGVNGNGEDAQIILEAAHKSTMTAGGFFLAGPIGGVAGSIFADSSMTLVDQIPKGTIDHVVRLKNKTASENIDLILDLTLSATDTNIKNLQSQSSRRQTMHLKMKKIPSPPPLSSPKKVITTESGGKCCVSYDKYLSKASLVVKEGSEAVEIFYQLYTPYQPATSPSQNDKEKQY